MPNGSALHEEWIDSLGPTLASFRDLVLERGRSCYRDLPWRQTHDPYAIWVSEVMLQQTQTSRVDGRWQRWLERFPTIEALAGAERADVLAEWQGLGYNRRALQLWQAACVPMACSRTSSMRWLGFRASALRRRRVSVPSPSTSRASI